MAKKDAETAKQELKAIIELLAKEGKRVAIFTHDSPDPDSIAAAVGLRFLLEKMSVSSTIFYGGVISHPQNQAMENTLDLGLIHSDKYIASEFAKIALCDATITGGKQVQMAIQPDWIIDHHEDSQRPPKCAEFVNNSKVGASSTLVLELIRDFGLDFTDTSADSIVATALSIGITTDTNTLMSENTTDRDLEAYRYLTKFLDRKKLTAILQYPLPSYLFDMEAIANEEKIHLGSTLVIGLGILKPSERDGLPVIADRYLRMEGVDTVIVFGIVEDQLIASMRTTNVTMGADKFIKATFGEQFGGGKLGAAGSKVPLGYLSKGSNSKEFRNKLWDLTKLKVLHDIRTTLGLDEEIVPQG